MNFEELIETRDARKTNKVCLPYGYLYKRQIDGKYTNFVEFRDELADNILFADCVGKECQAIAAISDKHQLHFTPNEGGEEGIYAVAVEPGNYITIEQLLNDTPAIVAKRDFLKMIVNDLVKLTVTLNEKNIQHVCFAPTNVFVRKSDNSVRLLLHGSFYHRLGMNTELYDGVESYVAPEVLRGDEVTDRSDVYSLAKFIDYLYTSSGLPLELKPVIRKALSEDPGQRYASVSEFSKAMQQRRAVFRSALMGIAAVLVALVVVGLFFDLLPSTDAVEFVKPVNDPISEELLDEGFDPATELGAAADSATIAAAIKDFEERDTDRVDAKKLREFEAKAEQVFRRQYTKEADRILSKIYTSDRMNNNLKNFEAASDRVMQELVAKQVELGEHSSLSSEKSQRIASEIIEQLTEKKKAEMEAKPNYGVQK